MILSNISEQHLNSVGVRRRIGLKIVETAFLYISRKNLSCGYSSHACQNVLGRFINLLRVKPPFTLERADSYENPLQKFSLRNRKKALWVFIGLDLVLNSLYCRDILASDNHRNMEIWKWWGLVHPYEYL